MWGLAARARADEHDIVGATRLVEDPKGVCGGVFGPVTQAEASLIVRRLLVSDDPDRTAQDLPWAAVAFRSNGDVAATTSSMFSSGIFYLAANGHASSRCFALATDPKSLAAIAAQPLRVDAEGLRTFVLMNLRPDQTPISGVARACPGDTVVWRSATGMIHIRPWLAPTLLPQPNRSGSGVVDQYVRAFDRVVRTLLERTGPIVATVSGGLDSSFMAASLMKCASTDTVVSGYCHTPLSAARLQSSSWLVADDLPYVAELAQASGGRLRAHPLRNDTLVDPVEAAAEASRLAWLPVSGPANFVWLNQFTDHAQRQGAALKFHARVGNAAFSNDHAYAANFYLQRRRILAAARLASPRYGNTSWRAGVRREWQALRRAPPDPDARMINIGLPANAIVREGMLTRERYLTWLTGRRGANPGLSNPALSPGCLRADPFASRTIIELAASIAPQEWRRGHASRAFARRAMAGRVPDAIRLRTARGGQSLDAWYVSHRNGRWWDDLDRIAASPKLGGWLDIDSLQAWLTDAVAVGPHAPAPAAYGDWLRLVAAVRWEAMVSG